MNPSVGLTFLNLQSDSDNPPTNPIVGFITAIIHGFGYNLALEMPGVTESAKTFDCAEIRCQETTFDIL